MIPPDPGRFSWAGHLGKQMQPAVVAEIERSARLDEAGLQRVAQRVRFAGDLEALWYLRQDVLTALSAVDGEVAARRQMQQINRLFKGGLPDTMGPRAHHL